MRTQYFRTWTSYQIPVRPAQPASYAELAGAAAYYRGTFDGNDRLLTFEKFLRARSPAGTLDLNSKRVPGLQLAFEAKSRGTDFVAVGEVPYPSTEGLAAYFEGTVGPGGDSVAIALVRQERVSIDEYEYWPDGQIKSRRLQNADGEGQYTEYDRRGDLRPAAIA